MGKEKQKTSKPTIRDIAPGLPIVRGRPREEARKLLLETREKSRGRSVLYNAMLTVMYQDEFGPEVLLMIKEAQKAFDLEKDASKKKDIGERLGKLKLIYSSDFFDAYNASERLKRCVF